MVKRRLIAAAIFPILLFTASYGRTMPAIDSTPTGADQDTGNWHMYGRTYDDHRFSPLDQINEHTVGKLGLAWSRELGTTRGLEATPLVEDGSIYVTGSWSVVYAMSAQTGAIRWIYDPKVPRTLRFSSAATW
jgi:quinohemoprotein ethanol dehydrogenase